jgi:uncharacterized protein YndB with AHSA1/START domain
VFRACTEPEELAKWWGPRGFTTPAIEIDLRVGGRYRFAMQPPEGNLFHLSGGFPEVDPPSAAYTFVWTSPKACLPLRPGGRFTSKAGPTASSGWGTAVGALTGRHSDRDPLKRIRGLGRRLSP